MRIAGSIIAAICGIVIIASIFLTWVDASGYFGYGYTASAWDLIDGSAGDWWYLIVVLVGGVLMALFAAPAFIVSLASKGGRAAIITLSLFAMVGSIMSIFGSAYFIIDAVGDDAFDIVSYGVWIAIAGAIVGFIFALLTASFSKGKQDW